MQPSLNFFAVTVGLLLGANTSTRDAQSRLLELRSLAYDANFRNETAQLRTLSQQLGELSTDADVGAAALYYAGWTDWALFNSEFEAGRKAEARVAIGSAVERLRRLAELTPDDADAQAMLKPGATLESIAARVAKEKIDPKPKSGRQEYYENLLNRYL